MKTGTRQRVGQRQLLTKQTARYIPKAIETMFKELERFSEEKNIELEWDTFTMEVAPQRDPALHPGERMIEILMQMDGVQRGDD